MGNLDVVDDSKVPKQLVAKYRAKCPKPADAFVAAFTEWIGAEILVTENRRFLKNVKITEFKVLTAKQFLKQ